MADIGPVSFRGATGSAICRPAETGRNSFTEWCGGRHTQHLWAMLYAKLVLPLSIKLF